MGSGHEGVVNGKWNAFICHRCAPGGTLEAVPSVIHAHATTVGTATGIHRNTDVPTFSVKKAVQRVPIEHQTHADACADRHVHARRQAGVAGLLVLRAQWEAIEQDR